MKAPGTGCFAAVLLFFLFFSWGMQVMTQARAQETRTAVFAGGCFWCVEADFDKLGGVIETVSGYTGGSTENPAYEDVTRGDTGHYEAVQVLYDPAQVSYEDLALFFWQHIDPTDPGGQFCDRGGSYRTAVFYDGDAEKAAAEKTKAAMESRLQRTVATRILPAAPFYRAEDYHQNYYIKNPDRYQAYRASCQRDGKIKSIWDK